MRAGGREQAVAESDKSCYNPSRSVSSGEPGRGGWGGEILPTLAPASDLHSGSGRRARCAEGTDPKSDPSGPGPFDPAGPSTVDAASVYGR